MTQKARFTLVSIGSAAIVLALLGVPCSVAEEDSVPPEPAIIDAEVLPPEIILKTQKAPVYPPAAKAARFDGVVTVKVHIHQDGKVSDIQVVDCSHKNIGFEEATVAAVKLWEFSPATFNGEPVDFDAQFRLNFRSSSMSVTSSAQGSSPRTGIAVSPPTTSRPSITPR